VRFLLLAVLAAGLTWAALTLWAGGPGGAPPAEPEAAEPAPESMLPSRTGVRGAGTVTLRVAAPDRSVPAGARVGYRYRGEDLWFPVNEAGWRRLIDVPLVELTFLADAPGHERVEVTKRLVPGVPDEMVLMLRPAADDDGGPDR
jgi:hypothetical protein